ncbi:MULTISPECIES: aldehyde dehydrogenase family protein [unclassified Streptomyces]|uniref:aldehyde dehydrogenase family protein n=1 Tax=unclassified Streptomyces TaxID=2593676 RepID=UPI0006AFA6F9|nr:MULTISPECIES: aldehyde dehydrogenase family protein [unclassified Streptomyces]KOX24874.1 aldehyde dehydrogenase [Streptomyces sp. NRRL F-6491]KOX40951.1 aldehyde dehydrogenase [Streptomyces sp. NRRL F-6492]
MTRENTARHWIDGEWVGSARISDSIDPATGKVIGTYADADAEVGQRAVDAARRAFEEGDWRLDPMVRSTALSHLADAYAARMDEVIDTLCLENGKLRHEAGFEAHFILRALRFAAGLAVQPHGRVTDTQPGRQAMSIRQPVGVAGIVVPWNSPAYLCIRALAPALAAGCTAVVKMPGQAARTAALMSEILASVPELPNGAVNVVVESGSDVARLLVESPRVPVISFTGSTATGRLIARDAAAHFKRVGLELGGKTPHLVFADADIEAALATAVASCTVFAGQFCMTGSRVLVQREIADEFTAALARRLESVRPGPASDPASQIGPLIDKAAVARVDAAVEAAVAAGAEPIVRGGPSTRPELAGGAFYHPTLLAVTDSSLPIVQEETFGPVQTVQVFDTEEEAIALANDTEYGLSACVWSRDADRPMRVARQLDAGLISINSWANLTVEFEEGGFKSSGVGRLGGPASVEDFLEYKQITQDYAPRHH